jgi:FkbM family methyltransferase
MHLVSTAARRVPARIRDVASHPLALRALRGRSSSFSQAGEDRIVDFVFGALGVERPSYLDIGAYHPVNLSNTALMHLRGSRGVNVEPDPDSFRAFQRYRRRDFNLNVGVGAEPGRQTLYRMSTPTLNTFSKNAAEAAVEESAGVHRIIETLEIEIRTVPSILHEYGGVPDFLSLDVEGNDLPIVRTMAEWPGLPTVVCVETITYSEHGRGVKIPEFTAELSGLGYMPFADTHINTIYVLSDRWSGR